MFFFFHTENLTDPCGPLTLRNLLLAFSEIKEGNNNSCSRHIFRSCKKNERSLPIKGNFILQTAVLFFQLDSCTEMKRIFFANFLCNFLFQISTHIVSCLNPYTKKDCTTGRITNSEDFKYLARKVSTRPMKDSFCFPFDYSQDSETWWICSHAFAKISSFTFGFCSWRTRCWWRRWSIANTMKT